MKTFALFLAVALVISAVQVSASNVSDADGSGAYSLDEMNVVYPDLTQAAFTGMDADASGEISDEELVAAVETGMLAE